MTTYADIKTHALLLLQDDIIAGSSVTGTDHGEGILGFAIESALDAILPKIWKPATDTILAGVRSHDLPADAYEVQGVLDIAGGNFLPSLIISAQAFYGTGTTGNSWILYPSDKVSFTNEIGGDGGTLYYAARWATPINDTDVLESPEYADTAVALYMVSHILLSDASGAGSLAQYKAKIDSGTPEDNPLLRLSESFLRRFDIEMNRLPMMAKGIS